MCCVNVVLPDAKSPYKNTISHGKKDILRLANWSRETDFFVKFIEKERKT